MHLEATHSELGTYVRRCDVEQCIGLWIWMRYCVCHRAFACLNARSGSFVCYGAVRKIKKVIMWNLHVYQLSISLLQMDRCCIISTDTENMDLRSNSGVDEVSNSMVTLDSEELLATVFRTLQEGENTVYLRNCRLVLRSVEVRSSGLLPSV
jgi:hypothetical protein